MKRLLLLSEVMLGLGLFGQEYRAVSPDGRNEIRLVTEPVLSYSVMRDGKVRIAASAIALETQEHGILGGKVQAVKSETRQVTGMLKTPVYKKSEVSLAGEETRVTFPGGWAVTLHARNDGVAYRFETSFGTAPLHITMERAPIIFAEASAQTWYGTGNAWICNWETVYTNGTAEALAKRLTGKTFAYMPLVAKFSDGGYLCISECDLLDYPGWLLRGDAANGVAAFRSDFAPVPDATTVSGEYCHKIGRRHPYIAATVGTRSYPWRLFMMSDVAVKLCENDLPYALAKPCAIGDAGWVRPGAAAWDWWNDWNISGVPFKAGKNTATYKHYIDFAAEFGLPYFMVDAGWAKEHGVDEVIPEVDLAAVLAHAKAKGVGIFLWCGWHVLIGRQDEVFAKYAKMGVKGFKIDGICRNDQTFVQYAQETAAAAARHHILVDYHGAYQPAGMMRTYPNVVNFEGVHGLENTRWEGMSWMARCDFPLNDLRSFFCRMTAGPMDYTPGAMINMTEKDYRYSGSKPGSVGTRVHQLALPILYEARFQMLCDSPTLYRKNRECAVFLSKVPTVWDETRGLTGDIDGFVFCARRKGDAWFVGGICSKAGYAGKLPLDFLGEGTWQADIFEDGINANHDAEDYTRRSMQATAKDVLDLRLASGGGFAAVFERRK